MPKVTKHKSLADITNSSSRPYVCKWPSCTYSSAYFNDITRHMRVHSGEKPFACDWPGCAYASARSDSLTTHMRIHSGEKPFSCDYPSCDYACANFRNLTTHMRIHSGEKPFSCDYPSCDYACAHSSNLTKHMRSHTREKPFACVWPDCSYASSRQCHLTRHMRTHSGEKPFACSWLGCDYACADSSSLTRHMRTHSSEKPFACDYPGCDYACSESGNLTTHMRTHTGEKPYACNYPGCGYASAARCNLSSHWKALHTEEGQQRHKRSEQATAHALEAHGIHFKREHQTSHECSGGTFSRTDFLIEAPGGLIDLENDEDQHKHYAVACETGRMLNIYNSRVLAGCTLPQMFVRFNPDAFSLDGKRVTGLKKAERRAKLADFLKIVDLRGAKPLQVVYLYYDAVTDCTTGKLAPVVIRDAEFDESLKQCVKYIGL